MWSTTPNRKQKATLMVIVMEQLYTYSILVNLLIKQHEVVFEMYCLVQQGIFIMFCHM